MVQKYVCHETENGIQIPPFQILDTMPRESTPPPKVLLPHLLKFPSYNETNLSKYFVDMNAIFQPF